MRVFSKLKEYQFLFEELVKRDFKQKYKRTILGMFWSVLSPLMTLGVMALIFTNLLGRNINHYIIYLFCGIQLFGYFRESTNTGMRSLYGNAGIFSKINVPKYLFVLSRNVSSLINFGVNLIVLFIFCIIDGITFTWKFILLIYPIICLAVFNLGMGLILSTLYIQFRDLKYLYSVFTRLLMYLSAIFYSIDSYDPSMQQVFYFNPIYICIRYFRSIIIDATIPPPFFHLIAGGYAILVLIIGVIVYKKNNHKFLYYV